MATIISYGAFLALLVAAAAIDLRELRIPNGLVAAIVAVWAVWRLLLVVTSALSGSSAAAIVPAAAGGLAEGACCASLIGAGFSSGGGGACLGPAAGDLVPFAGMLGGALPADPLEKAVDSLAPSAAEGVAGALALSGGLLAATLAYEALTGRRAMGGGDVKLMAAVGLFLGVEGGLACLMAACVVSLLLSLALPRLGWEPVAASRRRPCAPRSAARPGRPRAAPAPAPVQPDRRRADAAPAGPARRRAAPAHRADAALAEPARSRRAEVVCPPSARLAAVPFGPGIAVGAHVVVLLGAFVA